MGALQGKYVFQQNADEGAVPVALACLFLHICPLSLHVLYNIISTQLNGNEPKW